MGMSYTKVRFKTHRLIPSRFPPISVFDWAETKEELEEIVELESLTNERLQGEYGDISLVSKNDWVIGEGATPLMAAFTHPGYSRFSDGTYGVYYAGDSLETVIAETKFHRERFLAASNEVACLVQMREYLAYVKEELVNIDSKEHAHILDLDPSSYPKSQEFGRTLKLKNEYGLLYPSVRNQKGKYVAIFRPTALTIPIQGCHLDYVWDGHSIASVHKSMPVQ